MNPLSTCDLCDALRNDAGQNRRVQLRGVAVRPGPFLAADADGVIVLEAAP